MTATTSVLKYDCVVSSKIRLARNVEALQSPAAIASMVGSAAESGRFIANVYGMLSNEGDFELLRMSGLSENYKDSLIERRFITPELKKNSVVSAVILNKEEKISVMVNEKDHICLQCTTGGFSLENAYEKISEIDDRLISGLNILYDDRYGFITNSMTDIGTGMHASVTLFLPALTIEDYIGEVSRNLYHRGFAISGTYGIGDKVLGCMYEISNRVTIGKSESEIIADVKKAVEFIIAEEDKAREEMLAKEGLSIKNHIMRSKGILTNACILPLDEFIERLCHIKLGIGLGYIGVSDLQEFNKLFETAQSATIKLSSDGEMTDEDVEVHRAEFVARKLNKLLV